MILGPREGELTDDEVEAAYPWPEDRRWVRAAMVTTLDGSAVGPDGVSKSITGDADQLIFAVTRRTADVVLIGAGTMRAERYGASTDRGRLAIVSGSLDLPWEEEVFTDPEQGTLILTGPDSDHSVVPDACEVVVTDGSPHALIGALEERGLRKITCEGGPSLLRDLVAAGLVDEADITLSPRFAGTEQSPHAPALPEVAEFALAHVLTRDGFLMGRYLRDGDVA